MIDCNKGKEPSRERDPAGNPTFPFFLRFHLRSHLASTVLLTRFHPHELGNGSLSRWVGNIQIDSGSEPDG